MSFVVALTGGIGAGKSAAADQLAALGAAVVDTDAISRDLTAANGAAMPKLRDAFGPRFVTHDGALDREAMRTLAFADPEARARLESILHPVIRAAADRALAQARGAYAVIVVPLLFETRGYLDRVARVLVIDCPEPLQVERIVARSGLGEAEARAVIAAQWPRWRRLQMADDVIWNGAERALLERQCAARHRDYCERAAASATIAGNPRRGP